MPIVTKDEQLPVQPVIVLLVGDPGTAKTSLSNTCKNVLNIDFDLGFKRSYGRPDSLQLSNGWTEVQQCLNNGDFDKYDTIVVDTAKGCLDDFLMVYVQEQDYKLKTNKLKAYGAIGDEFKLFINVLRRKGKDIFIIAHSKNEGEGDTKKIVADITGQSNALLLRVADQVGFLSMRNNKRVITFNPSDQSVGKNVAGLKDIELPLHTDPAWKDFADREIISKVKEALTTMSESQRLALDFISKWHEAIDSVKLDDESLKALSTDVSKIEEEHLKKQVRAYLSAHLKKSEWKWDAANKVFVPVNPPGPPVEAKQEERPVVTGEDMTKEAEAQKAALNEPPTEETDLFASTEG